MLLVDGGSAGLPSVTGVLRVWKGQGEFRLELDTLASRGEGKSLWPTEKVVGEGFICERFWKGFDKGDGDELSK